MFSYSILRRFNLHKPAQGVAIAYSCGQEKWYNMWLGDRGTGKEEGVAMNDILVLIAIIAAWFVLNRYVLPKLGVKT
jgi:hypothetical protein